MPHRDDRLQVVDDVPTLTVRAAVTRPSRWRKAQSVHVPVFRIERLTDNALATRPNWLRPLDGGVCGDLESTGQRERVAVVAAYRDLTGTDSASLLGPDRATDQVGRRRRRIADHAAAQALSTAHRHDQRSQAR